LVPFWGAFCLPYCPRSANHESKTLKRRVLCFFVPALCKFAGALVSFLPMITDYMWSSPFPPIDEAKLHIITASFETTFFVLINWMYLRYQIKRPYISNRPSTYYGDPVNNAEIMTTRVLCWGAIMFLSQSALKYWTESDS